MLHARIHKYLFFSFNALSDFAGHRFLYENIFKNILLSYSFA